MDQMDPTYPGGAAALIAHWDLRRDPIKGNGVEGLPPIGADLAGLLSRKLPPIAPKPKRPASGFANKQHKLTEVLAGHSELALLNALVIAHLRKRSFPPHAPALFLRIWAEHGQALIAELPLRWLISSAITFASHGPTEADRHLGQSLNLLFSLMKLYEFERQFSGFPSATPFPLGGRLKGPLALGMPDFALTTGGLDINLLAPIWQAAETAPALGPLACHLLTALNHDPGTLFRRLQSMRKAKQEKRAAKAAKP